MLDGTAAAASGRPRALYGIHIQITYSVHPYIQTTCITNPNRTVRSVVSGSTWLCLEKTFSTPGWARLAGREHTATTTTSCGMEWKSGCQLSDPTLKAQKLLSPYIGYV